MGSLLQERGQLEAALASFEEAYATLRPLPVDQEPAEPGRLSELAAAQNSLAVVLRLLGRFDAARLHAEAELALRRRRAGLDPADWPAQDELATALHYQGFDVLEDARSPPFYRAPRVLLALAACFRAGYAPGSKILPPCGQEAGLKSSSPFDLFWRGSLLASGASTLTGARGGDRRRWPASSWLFIGGLALAVASATGAH